MTWSLGLGLQGVFDPSMAYNRYQWGTHIGLSMRYPTLKLTNYLLLSFLVNT
jgi:hypothetical protein